MITQEYGSLNICLKELMENKGISRYRLAYLADTQFEVVDWWYKGKVERLDLDILTRFCYVLNCNPEDVLRYKK